LMLILFIAFRLSRGNWTKIVQIPFSSSLQRHRAYDDERKPGKLIRSSKYGDSGESIVKRD